MNHEGYQRRLDLIQEVLKSYGLEVADISTLLILVTYTSLPADVKLNHGVNTVNERHAT